MIAASDIKKMSIPERLQAIELLWSSMSLSENTIPSPEWHQEVLAARRARVESGAATFISLAELRKRVSQSHS